MRVEQTRYNVIETADRGARGWRSRGTRPRDDTGNDDREIAPLREICTARRPRLMQTRAG